MKAYLFVFVVLCLALNSCKDSGSIPPPPIEYVPGEVSVQFVDTLNQSQANAFIRSLNLVPKDLSFINSDAHWGWVYVPIGQEMKWIDSLKTYTAYVVNADLNHIHHLF